MTKAPLQQSEAPCVSQAPPDGAACALKTAPTMHVIVVVGDSLSMFVYHMSYLFTLMGAVCRIRQHTFAAMP